MYRKFCQRGAVVVVLGLALGVSREALSECVTPKPHNGSSEPDQGADPDKCQCGYIAPIKCSCQSEIYTPPHDECDGAVNEEVDCVSVSTPKTYKKASCALDWISAGVSIPLLGKVSVTIPFCSGCHCEYSESPSKQYYQQGIPTACKPKTSHSVVNTGSAATNPSTPVDQGGQGGETQE